MRTPLSLLQPTPHEQVLSLSSAHPPLPAAVSPDGFGSQTHTAASALADAVAGGWGKHGPLLASAADAAASPFSPGKVWLWSPETALAPLNGESEQWVRVLVWTDFRVAVAVFVAAPLLLLGLAVAARVPPGAGPDRRSALAEPVLRYMTSYWQASSLLLLTVGLNLQESRLGVPAGLLAQAMILVSLWWWRDLSEELETAAAGEAPPSGGRKDPGTGLARAFLAWRAVATLAAFAGVLAQLPFQLPCGGEGPPLPDRPLCAPWLEPPFYAASLVAGPNEAEAHGLGLSLAPVVGAGCLLYAGVLVYYAGVLVPAVGRSGRAKRPALAEVATPIAAWKALGFLDEDDDAGSGGEAAGR
ncbi:unnamed protein product [Pseudo-nitzschia multistriata]|uniref:Uncharacterized protein n=1 Tax=Pseudo-nitzschia multistriata TaxID=183589 RepID=A0A448ZDV2_9STRA|nr:unnamed protein product [Pseudo-nitzschia multistriata]